MTNRTRHAVAEKLIYQHSLVAKPCNGVTTEPVFPSGNSWHSLVDTSLPILCTVWAEIKSTKNDCVSKFVLLLRDLSITLGIAASLYISTQQLSLRYDCFVFHSFMMLGQNYSIKSVL